MSGKKKGWASAFTGLFIQTDDNGAGASGGSGEVDIEALLRETSAMTSDLPDSAPPPRASAPPSPYGTPAAASAPIPAGLVIGQPLVELYEAYGVPKSPKSVEEIVLFLQGLKNMPHNVQTQALKAMDDADPNWSIADVLHDGRNKIAALSKEGKYDEAKTVGSAGSTPTSACEDPMVGTGVPRGESGADGLLGSAAGDRPRDHTAGPERPGPDVGFLVPVAGCGRR